MGSMSSMSRFAPFVVLLGAILSLLGGGLLLKALLRPDSFVRTEAELVRFGHPQSTGMLEPIVAFEVDGRRVEARCQDVPMDKYRGKVGDRVKIAYSAGRALGMRTLKVYLDDGKAPQRDRAIQIAASSVFLIAGVAVLIFGLKLLAG